EPGLQAAAVAAGIRPAGVARAVDVEHGDRTRRRAAGERELVLAGDGGDRGDEVGGLAGEALAHRRAVRHAGEEDALRIDRGPRRDVGEQCTDVADVVDAGGARGAADADVAVAPAAGVPGANAVR